jgi:hypothetical protein
MAKVQKSVITLTYHNQEHLAPSKILLFLRTCNGRNSINGRSTSPEDPATSNHIQNYYPRAEKSKLETYQIGKMFTAIN